MPESPLTEDFSYPAAPGGEWPAIMGGYTEEPPPKTRPASEVAQDYINAWVWETGD